MMLGDKQSLDPKSNEPNFRTDLTHRFEADKDANALATTARFVPICRIGCMRQ